MMVDQAPPSLWPHWLYRTLPQPDEREFPCPLCGVMRKVEKPAGCLVEGCW